MMGKLHISLVIVTAFLMLLEVQQTAVYSLWYQVDNESFTSTYCLNVDQPELDCYGSCKMSSEAEILQDQSDNPIQISLKSALDVLHFVYPLDSVELPSKEFENLSAATHYVELYCYRFAQSVFHPPISI